MADEKPEEQLKKLTPKERVFVEFYLGKCFLNATAAARAADYSNPNAHAAEIRSRPHVAAEIEKQLAEHGATKEATLRFLADVQAGAGAYAIPMGTRLEYDIDQMIEDGKAHLIKGTREKAGGKDEDHIYEVEIHDAMAAASLLARIHRLDRGVEVNITLPPIREIVVNRPFPAEAAEEDGEPAEPVEP